MQVHRSAVNATTSDYARELRARAAASQAQEARRSEVAADAAKARSSPGFEASETRKQQAKAKLQQVRDWLKIVRKLYAQNPKGMAKALAQVFKDLKAAVQAYKDAGGQEIGAAGAAVGAVLSSANGQEATKTPEKVDAPTADDSKEPAGAEVADGEAAAAVDADAKAASESPVAEGDAALAAAGGRSIYDAVVSEVRKQVGEDGLDFLKEVRGMVEDIQKLLQTARGQAAIRKRDKDTETAFQDADKALKDVKEAMAAMDRDIRAAAPGAGMRLSIAA